MFDRITLDEELIDCRGAVLAPAGTVLSPEVIEAAGRSAPAAPRLPPPDPGLGGELAAVLEAPAYRHLFPGAPCRQAVADVLAQVRLPALLWEELLAVQRAAPVLHRHGVATAAVAVRMLLLAVPDGRGVPDLAAAGLLHDLGMRHLPVRLLRHAEPLSRAQEDLVARHPLIGAFHVARLLGSHVAVAAALSHHWRGGRGYPHLAGGPARSVEAVAVASAFAALTQPRAYRSSPYDARAAVDLLVAEARGGTADQAAVRLLVHALRGGKGDLRAVRFGASRGGARPKVNHHTQVTAPGEPG